MLNIIERIQQRECGECNLCCTLVGVKELGKPNNTPCEHVCKQGCSIWKDRPQPCRDWFCAWRQGVIKEEKRPDELGIIFNLDQINHCPDNHTMLECFEMRPNALQENKDLILDLLNTYPKLLPRIFEYERRINYPCGNSYPINPKYKSVGQGSYPHFIVVENGIGGKMTQIYYGSKTKIEETKIDKEELDYANKIIDFFTCIALESTCHNIFS